MEEEDDKDHDEEEDDGDGHDDDDDGVDDEDEGEYYDDEDEKVDIIMIMTLLCWRFSNRVPNEALTLSKSLAQINHNQQGSVRRSSETNRRSQQGFRAGFRETHA